MQGKLLISNQHGAWVMALLPFLYGMSQSPFVWQSVFLFLGWSCLYLMTYPFLSLFKGRNLALYRKWTLIYGVATAFFLAPAFYFEPSIFFFGVAILPFVMVNIYYVKTKNERALINDFAGISIFAIMAAGAYFFTAKHLDFTAVKVMILPSAFFMATTLYVKSMLRERKNPVYYWASVMSHFVLIVFFGCFAWQLALSVLPALIRAIVLPYQKLSVKQVGLTEFAISGSFALGLFGV